MSDELDAMLDALADAVAEEHPKSYMRGGSDSHFCDGFECDWDSGHRARIMAEARKVAARFRDEQREMLSPSVSQKDQP